MKPVHIKERESSDKQSECNKRSGKLFSVFRKASRSLQKWKQGVIFQAEAGNSRSALNL